MLPKQGSQSSKTTENHEEFRKLLEDISNAYSGKKRYRWLRLLLNDHCSGNLLSKPVNEMTGFDLFNDLKGQHYIFRDPTDVAILLDIGEVTKQASVVQLVKDFQEKYPNTDANYKSKCKKISTFRKKLFNAVKENGNPVKQMHASYNDELKGEVFDDIWDFVFKLEREDCLTEASKERFANLLDGKAKKILDAANGNAQGGSSGVVEEECYEVYKPELDRGQGEYHDTAKEENEEPSTSQTDPMEEDMHDGDTCLKRIQNFIEERAKRFQQCWCVCGILLIPCVILEIIFYVASTKQEDVNPYIKAGYITFFIIFILLVVIFAVLSFIFGRKYKVFIECIAAIVTIISVLGVIDLVLSK